MLTIRQLDPVYFKTKRTVVSSKESAEKAIRLDMQTGQALFIKGCSTCHTIGGGDHVGPDLKDVAERRDKDWLMRFLMAPEKMRAQKDPLTMQLMAQYNNIKMPSLGLKEPDVEDVLTFIEAQSRIVDAKAAQAKATDAKAADSETPDAKASDAKPAPAAPKTGG